MQNLGYKLEDTFLPGVADEEVTIQPVRVHHQCPAHLAHTVCHRHEILRVDGVDTRPEDLVRGLEVVLAVIWWPNLAFLDRFLHLLAQVLQVRTSDAPALRRDGLVQLHRL